MSFLGCSPNAGKQQIAPSPRVVQLQDYERFGIHLGGRVLAVYLADTDIKRQEGLMFVTSQELGENEGMFFVFPNAQIRRFWMKNTVIPLDIAYLDPDGVIVNILTMEPLDESGYLSARPAQYALETGAGWFARNGVKPGDRVDLGRLKKSF